MSKGLKPAKNLMLNRFLPSRVWNLVATHAKKPGGLLAAFIERNRKGTVDHSELKTLADDLRAAGGKLERDFLTTGVALEKLAGEGEQFVAKAEKFVNYATGRSGGAQLFQDALPVVENPLNFLTASRPNTQRILERLQKDSERIDELINFQVELQRTIGPLRYIQALFKIESAPLGGEVQAMFGSLTKEIETLHDQICELFTTRFLELRALQSTLDEVICELKTRSDELWVNITRGKTQIEKSLAQLQHELSANQERESHISQLSKRVNEEIQGVVMGLQYQDIINQKLQHTFASLVGIEEAIESGENTAALGQSCRLEAAQLKAVREELTRAETSIRQGVARTMDQLVCTDGESLTLADFNQLTKSTDGMVGVLLDALAMLRKQVDATVVSSAKAYERLRPAGGLAFDLTHVVRDLSMRIHLIGLNAQLQAAQVGHGAALEVLSARTSDISRATTRISEEVAQKLDELVHDLGHDVKTLESLQADALKQKSALETEGLATEQRLHQMRDGTLELQGEINGLLSEIRNDAQQLAGSINYVETADGALAKLEERLASLAEQANASEPISREQADALMEQARHRYTMTSERNVFAEVLGGQVDASSRHEENAVELFDAPAESLPVNANAEQQEPAPKDMVATNLGNNVELF